MMCEIWVMRASPAVAQGVAPRGAVGRNDEAWAVFATNANVPADGVDEGGGHIMRRRKLEGKLLQWDSLGRGICARPGKDPEHVRELGEGGMWV